MKRIVLLLILWLSATAARAAMVVHNVDWTLDGTRFHSVLVYDGASKALRPGLVMVPNWYGVNNDAIAKAKLIAGDRYVILLTRCATSPAVQGGEG